MKNNRGIAYSPNIPRNEDFRNGVRNNNHWIAYDILELTFPVLEHSNCMDISILPNINLKKVGVICKYMNVHYEFSYNSNVINLNLISKLEKQLLSCSLTSIGTDSIKVDIPKLKSSIEIWENGKALSEFTLRTMNEKNFLHKIRKIQILLLNFLQNVDPKVKVSRHRIRQINVLFNYKELLSSNSLNILVNKDEYFSMIVKRCLEHFSEFYPWIQILQKYSFISVTKKIIIIDENLCSLLLKHLAYFPRKFGRKQKIKRRISV